jgi:hypothetical protein
LGVDELKVTSDVTVGAVFVFRTRLEGVNRTLRPATGTELAERFTVSLNPELTRVRVAFAFFPELKVTPDGVSELVKLITLTDTVAECVTTPTPPRVPFEPEIVTE